MGNQQLNSMLVCLSNSVKIFLVIHIKYFFFLIMYTDYCDYNSFDFIHSLLECSIFFFSCGLILWKIKYQIIYVSHHRGENIGQFDILND